MAVDASNETEPDLSSLRTEFLARVWIGALVVTSLAVPLSLARTFFTGWQPAYGLQFILLAVLGAGYLLREYFSFRVRAVTIITLLDLNGFVSMLSFGLFGASWWWFFMASLLVGLLFRTRAGMFHAGGSMLVIALLGLLFTLGWLSINFDANDYNRQFFPWAALLLGPVLLTMFVLRACDAFLRALPLSVRKAL